MRFTAIKASVLSATIMIMAANQQASAATYTLDVTKDLSYYEAGAYQYYSEGGEERIYLFALGAGLGNPALIGFEALPVELTGATINSAVIRVELARSFGDTIEVRRLTQAWNEDGSGYNPPASASPVSNGASWNTTDGTTAWTGGAGAMGNTDTATDSILLPNLGATTAGTFIDFDVTSIVQGWADGTFADHGFMFLATNSVAGTTTRFFSREASDGTGPRLIIDAEPIPEPAGISILVAGAMAAAHRRRRL